MSDTSLRSGPAPASGASGFASPSSEPPRPSAGADPSGASSPAPAGSYASYTRPPEETDLGHRTWTVLVAALGGEGGGVLSSWLVDAASGDGRRVQATSVPGVAQRTGATTYYLEIGPRCIGDDEGERQGPEQGQDGKESARDGVSRAAVAAGSAADPAVGSGTVRGGNGSVPGSAPDGQVMALLPTPGNVDLLVASELLEAGRAAQNGMITPDRTTVIASTHRMFAIAEKSAMGDGRFNDERVRRAVRELSRRHVLTDLGKVAERAGTVLSSVLLGAIAGSGALPIPRERMRSAIERAGIAVEANLRGFDAGYRLFDEPEPTGSGPDSRPASDPAGGREGTDAGMEPAVLPASLAARVEALPESIREFARLGARRTVDYQDVRYGALYLERLERLLASLSEARPAEGGASSEGGPPPARPPQSPPAPDGAGGAARAAPGEAPAAGRSVVGREAARQLALWMCFEDIIRVADLKTRRTRIERVRAEVRAKPGQPVAITEFLKPGVDEWCSLLPAWLARPILRAADRGGWRRRLNVGLHVRTSSVSGFLLLWTLARLKRLRRGMHRYREEQERIERWLSGVREAGVVDSGLALEVAKCANLVKGYGDTHERGVRNFERTMACLAACASAPDPAGSLRALREAALADPEGGRLDAEIAALSPGKEEAEAVQGGQGRGPAS